AAPHAAHHGAGRRAAVLGATHIRRLCFTVSLEPPWVSSVGRERARAVGILLFMSERLGLHVAQVVRIAGPAAANEAGLLGDVAQMLSAAVAARRRNGQYALVDGDRVVGIGGVIISARVYGDYFLCADFLRIIGAGR